MAVQNILSLTITLASFILDMKGPLNKKFLSEPVDANALGTLCARVQGKIRDSASNNTLNLTLEWGSWAITRNERAPSEPNDARCVLRSTQTSSCVLHTEGKLRKCTLKLEPVSLSPLKDSDVGPGWKLLGELGEFKLPVGTIEIRVESPHTF